MAKISITLCICLIAIGCDFALAVDDHSRQFLGKSLENYSKRLEYNPDDLKIGDAFRELCRSKKQYDFCIDELIRIQKTHPDNVNIKYQLALSYIDKVPGLSLFKQGWLSTRAMSQMSDVLDRDKKNWAAYYIRGLNSMYWPVSFRKLPNGIADLHAAIELSSAMPQGLIEPYHVLAYIALGDAYVKSGEVNEARKIYNSSKKIMASPKIDDRLSKTDAELEAFIEEIRNADHPVDTDISFLIDGGRDKL